MDEILKKTGVKTQDGEWNTDTIKGIAIGAVLAIVILKLSK